ncbi:MAG TPA: GyrI-like domain-containing protein [Gemmatimonadales bacterium]|nr:GyrI-like domain-containing protein [Gemmatimonadales bacterium]
MTIGAARYLTVAGRGDPNGPAFGAAVGALYGIAYTIKMAKKAGGRTLEARVRLETQREGRCVQMLHRGPYRAEHATITAMVAFARGRGLRPRGRHHEIYLSDPRRVAPAKLRTILRQPVR